MKLFKSARKYGAAALASTAGFVGMAHAAVPADVTTSITSVGTDGATIGGAVLAVIIGIVAFKYLRKAV